MDAVGLRLTEEQLQHIDNLADRHDASRSAVMRSIVDNGLRAPKYHPDEFDINPEQYELADALELTKEGQLPR